VTPRDIRDLVVRIAWSRSVWGDREARDGMRTHTAGQTVSDPAIPL
jgi:hypothetical protein